MPNEELLSFFYSYLRVPYNNTVKIFKENKKFLEKYISGIVKKIVETKKKTYKSKQELITHLVELKQQLNDAKEKMTELSLKEEEYFNLLGKRIHFLKDFETLDPSKDDEETEELIKRLMYTLIIEYLMRNSLNKTAEKIESETEHDFSVEKELIKKGKDIIDSFNSKKVEKAIAWCHENKSKLAKLQSNFEFDLVIWNYVFKLKEEGETEAMYYIQDNLPPVEGQKVEILKKMMTGLVIGKGFEKCRVFKQFFEKDSWNKLINKFIDEQFEIEGVMKKSLFEIILQAGICCIKTSKCKKQTSKMSNSCPVCDKHVSVFSEGIPYTSKIRSFMTCRISKKEMNNNNPPVVLPNNQVYSSESIDALAKGKDKSFKCPETGDTFSLSDTKRIYLTS